MTTPRLCALAAILVLGAACNRGAGAGDEPVPDASLTGTYWKVVAIGGEPVELTADMREPNLVLDGSGHAKGFGGCNRFFGSFEQVENSLTLGPLGATRMACEHGMDIEDRLLAALGRVRYFEIHGDSLTLRDEAGTDLVELEAVYLP
jgi:heat shock protein HslJ